jgi:hypothetical protein
MMRKLENGRYNSHKKNHIISLDIENCCCCFKAKPKLISELTSMETSIWLEFNSDKCKIWRWSQQLLRKRNILVVINWLAVRVDSHIFVNWHDMRDSKHHVMISSEMVVCVISIFSSQQQPIMMNANHSAERLDRSLVNTACVDALECWTSINNLGSLKNTTTKTRLKCCSTSYIKKIFFKYDQI